MVFSTVQISMPGTSCAGASAGVSTQAVTITDPTRAIRPIIKILIQLALVTVNLLRARCGLSKIPH
jgi:hypothetical protein